MTERLPSRRCIGCGACCKAMPGAYHPTDHTLPEFIDMVRRGNCSIDWWEGDTPTYYVRPATLLGRGLTWDPSWGGQCVNLTLSGCSLTREAMPTECKELKPGPERRGCVGAGKTRIKDLWKPYQEEFLKLAEVLK